MTIKLTILALVMVASSAFCRPSGAADASASASQPAKPLSAAQEDKAIKLVNQRSEVKNWLKLFKGPGNTSPKTGGKPSWQVDREKGDLVSVKVAEDMADHQVTFGFYEVNLRTGKVTKENY